MAKSASESSGFSTEEEAFFTAIGHLVVAWAMIETSLDYAVALIYRKLGGDQLELERPQSLSPKIKFLKKALRKLPALEEFEPFRLVLAEVKAEAGIRHDLVHGFLLEMPPDGATSAEMVRFNLPGRPESETRFSMTTKKVQRHARKAMSLANLLSQDVWELYARFGPLPPLGKQSR